MQISGNASSEASTTYPDCVFCHRNQISPYILKETATFRVLADHAPLVEGHILIVPKQHYACYGTVPAELDTELFALKHEIQDFLTHFYAPVVFWEHGVFRQTVYHAHLHCFPFGEIRYDPASTLHGQVVKTQDEIRSWYAAYGNYFYLQDHSGAYLFAPQLERYYRVIREVLWAGASVRNGNHDMRSPQQRYEEGKVLIKALTTNWNTFFNSKG
ncbi:HIT family protein [Ktedonosporobacter rubrisoli]|uniref:HIT family protein n=1 Tax=Ktedonosporobacter rubrisoli TaxID=2509675 RepID=A0A4V0YY23_KTERU|nr:HIT family protein [Ktedonosporobacter rubrisoli]QBD74721.1 HIT family protein [Ktedonosporobacter rubrisoli]